MNRALNRSLKGKGVTEMLKFVREISMFTCNKNVFYCCSLLSFPFNSFAQTKSGSIFANTAGVRRGHYRERKTVKIKHRITL